MQKNMPEIPIRLMDLPHNIKGFVLYDDEGEPNIYINARSSYDEQKKAVRHELRHIRRADAFSRKNIRTIER